MNAKERLWFMYVTIYGWNFHPGNKEKITPQLAIELAFEATGLFQQLANAIEEQE